MTSNISNHQSRLAISNKVHHGKSTSTLTEYLSASSNLGQNKQVIVNAIQDLNLTVREAQQILTNLEELESAGNSRAVNDQAASSTDRHKIQLVTEVMRKLKGDHRSWFCHYGSTEGYKVVISALKAINNGSSESIRGKGRGALCLSQKRYFFAAKDADFDNKATFLYAIRAKASMSNKAIRNLELNVGELSKVDPEGLDLTGTKLDENSFRALYGAGVRDFSGCDLSGANLMNADLRNVNFSVANLARANLVRANLSGANLNGTDFRGADFGDANLGDAKISSAKFSGAKFNSANTFHEYFINAKLDGDSFKSLYNVGIRNFSNCDLSGADLSNADLSETKLYDTNLGGTNLSNANLKGAKLYKANLKGALLYNANLYSATLSSADLSDADLSDADLNSALCAHANFHAAKLSAAKLYGADLSHADLRNANLSNAIFSIVGFGCAVIFKDATFGNTKLIDVIDYWGSTLVGAKVEENCTISQSLLSKLTNEQLKNCKLDFASGNLDQLFNYLNNRESGSILFKIDQLKNVGIKEYFMLQVFKYLADKDIYSILPALKGVLLNGSTDYSSMLNKHPPFRMNLLNNLYKCGNAKDVTISLGEIKLVLDEIQSMEEPSRKEFMFNNNNYFIQLIHHGRSSSDEGIKQRINTIWGEYCAINEVSDAYEKSQSTFWQDSIDECLIFYKKESSKFLVVQNEYLDKFLYQHSSEKSEHIIWNSMVFIDNGNIKQIDAKEVFGEFTLFLEIYNSQERDAKFTKLLDLLSLGDDYLSEFKKATTVRSYRKKLVDSTAQERLRNIFNRYFVDVEEAKPYGACSLAGSAAKILSLSQPHLEKIFDACKMKDESPQQKAKLLLILAGLFAKYSSSKVFATEDNSPTALRYYAYGLMKAAHDLDKSVVPDSKYEEWATVFLGIGNAFTCTAVLSSAIIQHCHNFSDYSTHFSDIFPPAWS